MSDCKGWPCLTVQWENYTRETLHRVLLKDAAQPVWAPKGACWTGVTHFQYVVPLQWWYGGVSQDGQLDDEGMFAGSVQVILEFGNFHPAQQQGPRSLCPEGQRWQADSQSIPGHGH